MSYTQADADSLRAAIASGVKQVQFGTRSTTYQDLDEMREVLVQIEAEVAGSTPRPRQRLAYQAGKGL
jgi:hypothetical protein